MLITFSLINRWAYVECGECFHIEILDWHVPYRGSLSVCCMSCVYYWLYIRKWLGEPKPNTIERNVSTRLITLQCSLLLNISLLQFSTPQQKAFRIAAESFASFIIVFKYIVIKIISYFSYLISYSRNIGWKISVQKLNGKLNSVERLLVWRLRKASNVDNMRP